jgi:prevent-host-death family protein
VVRPVSSRDARANFAGLLGNVHDTQEPIVIEKGGKPCAVLISPDQFAAIDRERERTWGIIQQVQERNTDKDPDEVYRDVTAVVEEVRQVMYADAR